MEVAGKRTGSRALAKYYNFLQNVWGSAMFKTDLWFIHTWHYMYNSNLVSTSKASDVRFRES